MTFNHYVGIKQMSFCKEIKLKQFDLDKGMFAMTINYYLVSFAVTSSTLDDARLKLALCVYGSGRLPSMLMHLAKFSLLS